MAAAGAGSVASAGSVAEIEALCHVRQPSGQLAITAFRVSSWSRELGVPALPLAPSRSSGEGVVRPVPRRTSRSC